MMGDPQIVQLLTKIVESLAEGGATERSSHNIDEAFERWDSLHQMKVLIAIEEEFGIKFSPHEIVRPKGMQHLVRMVRQKLQVSN